MREKEKSTRVIFVRHGETDFPINRIYCDGKEDPPLNAKGLLQAQGAAEYLASFRVDSALISPYLRTKMTASEVLDKQGPVPFAYDERLRERSFGIWEGLYFDEIERDFPVEYRSWKENQAAFKPKGGESVYDLADRVREPVLEFIEKNRGGVVMVVAHVGPIRVLLSEGIGLPIENYRRLQIDPASVSIVDYGVRQNNLMLMNFHARHA